MTSLKYCRNPLEAEDNVHDTFLTVFAEIKRFKGKGSFEGWMRRIAINKAISKFKNNIKDNAELPMQLADDTLVHPEEVMLPLDTILAAIQQLPDQYRLVFNMFQLDGYTHKEIAKELGISEGTSKSNYHRAKVLLRKTIVLPQDMKAPKTNQV